MSRYKNYLLFTFFLMHSLKSTGNNNKKCPQGSSLVAGAGGAGGSLFKSVSSDEAFLVKVELVQMLGKVDRMEKLE